jgi:hypothetical protein
VNSSYSRPSLDIPSGSQSGLSPSQSRLRPVSPADSRQASFQADTPASAAPPSRRDLNDRISFFDPANQAALERLISGGSGTQNDQNEGEGEDEMVRATMADVEEMIEGYEWASEDVIGRRASKGAADLIEARLLDELMALEKVYDHSDAYGEIITEPSYRQTYTHSWNQMNALELF